MEKKEIIMLKTLSFWFAFLSLVLLTVELGSIDQVGESRLDLGPGTGLQTTVRVDPELLGLEVLQHLRDTLLDFLLRGDTGGVDVVDTRLWILVNIIR